MLSKINPFLNYPEKICPFVFKNAKILDLRFYGLVEHFLFRNMLEFDSKFDNSDSLNYLNAGINSVILNGYKYKLSKKMLNPFVFQKI
jgi:hypothetical protein